MVKCLNVGEALDDPLLNESQINWLQASIFCQPRPSDLRDCYAFDHVLNGHRKTEKLSVDKPDTAPSLLWRLSFFTPASIPVLTTPLARRVYPKRRLHGGTLALGPIAYNAELRINTDFRGQQFARKLYEAEAQLYSSWGLKQIHLSAEDEGLVVWMHSFHFIPVDPEVLLVAWRRWLQRTGSPQPAERPPWHELPAQFLRTLGQIELYKVIE